MDVVQQIYRLGGVTQRKTLVRLTSRRAVDRALREGSILRDSHGRYAVPVADDAVRKANSLAGVVSHRSAAAYWGWEQKVPHHHPEVTVPRRRKVAAARRRDVTLHWVDLGDDEVEGLVTSRRRTVVDCMRSLPFDEALAIADSALRNGSFLPEQLVQLAHGVSGPGAAQCRRVAAAADGAAANPFESTLRALSHSVPGLDFVPQAPVDVGSRILHPDLVDVERRVIAEADSFEWHGSRRALRRDCRRYNMLVLRGWIVLRFAWEDVMLDPAYVRGCLEAAARLVRRPAQRRRTARRAA